MKRVTKTMFRFSLAIYLLLPLPIPFPACQGLFFYSGLTGPTGQSGSFYNVQHIQTMIRHAVWPVRPEKQLIRCTHTDLYFDIPSINQSINQNQYQLGSLKITRFHTNLSRDLLFCTVVYCIYVLRNQTSFMRKTDSYEQCVTRRSKWFRIFSMQRLAEINLWVL